MDLSYWRTRLADLNSGIAVGDVNLPSTSRRRRQQERNHQRNMEEAARNARGQYRHSSSSAAIFAIGAGVGAAIS